MKSDHYNQGSSLIMPKADETMQNSMLENSQAEMLHGNEDDDEDLSVKSRT
jgi:hypothetical protein